MVGEQFDAHGEAREALSTAIKSYGARVLSDARMLGNLVTDLLPDSPLERNLIVIAAEAGVATELTHHVDRQHLAVNTAIALVARGLTEGRAIELAASTWVTTEYARALGFQPVTQPPALAQPSLAARSAPPVARSAPPVARSAPPVARSAPPVAQYLPPPLAPQAAPPQSPVTPAFPQPWQSPPVPPFPMPQGPMPQGPMPQAPPPTASVPPLGTIPPAVLGAAAPGPTVPSPGFAPVGYPRPAWTPPTPPTPPYPRKSRTALIVGLVVGAVVVLGGGGVGAALAFKPTPKPPPPPPPRPGPTLSGAHLVGTFTAPDGATFSNAFLNRDGTLILAEGGAKNTDAAYFFSATTHKYISTVKVVQGDEIVPLALTPDDKSLLAADCTKTSCAIYLWDIATGQHGTGPSVPSAQFAVDDDGGVLATETRNGQFIDTYDLQTGGRTGHFPNPTTASIVDWSIQVSADGAETLVSAVDGTTYVVSSQTGQTLAKFRYTYAPTPKDPVNPQGQLPGLSPDGKTVVIPGTKTAPPQVWNVATQGNITPKDPRWPKTGAGATSPLYSSDGTVIVTGIPDSPYQDLWNVDTGSFRSRITIPGSNHWTINGAGPGGGELLFGSVPDKNQDSATLYLYAVP